MVQEDKGKDEQLLLSPRLNMCRWCCMVNQLAMISTLHTLQFFSHLQFDDNSPEVDNEAQHQSWSKYWFGFNYFVSKVLTYQNSIQPSCKIAVNTESSYSSRECFYITERLAAQFLAHFTLNFSKPDLICFNVIRTTNFYKDENQNEKKHFNWVKASGWMFNLIFC